MGGHGKKVPCSPSGLRINRASSQGGDGSLEFGQVCGSNGGGNLISRYGRCASLSIGGGSVSGE